MQHAKVIASKIVMVLIVLFSLYGCLDIVESKPLISSDEEMKNTIETLPKEDLSSNEKDGLIFMREEEKLARDVYITLYQKWGEKVFDNISKSEQKHTDAIKYLLDKYELEDPMEVDDFGVFKNENLQNLYNTLIETGKKSLVDALLVGAAIEEIDILDLLKYKVQIDNEDINLVYDNLTRGSRNHLRAYVKNLKNQGVDYVAHYMTQEDFLEIINSDMERGSNISKGGYGRRGGRGK